MKAISLEELAKSVDGTILAGDASAAADQVSTDSRAIPKGCVFVALRGEKFDGHDHLAEAGGKGASIAIVDRDMPLPNGVAVVKVPDTRRALGQLARIVRRSIPQTTVIAIAGSNGKTSTKNVLHSVLSHSLKGTASPKSFNNDIGVPATLFPVADDDDYVILEIGTNHPGEVEHLSHIAEPDIAVITSIGEEHLEFFQDLDGVRRENAAVIAGMPRDSLLIINGDDPHLPRYLSHFGGEMVRFGFAESNDLIARDIRVTLDGTSFTLDHRRYTIPAIGRHFASNALGVIAVARAMGLTADQIHDALATSRGSDMRMEKRLIHEITLINDAYNANPTSMRAGLETLSDICWPGRKVAVLGEMKELGAHSAAAHSSMADVLNALSLDAVVTIGQAWQEPSQRMAGAHWFEDAADPRIATLLQAGDLVLLKGSRSMRLERIAESLASAQR